MDSCLEAKWSSWRLLYLLALDLHADTLEHLLPLIHFLSQKSITPHSIFDADPEKLCNILRFFPIHLTTKATSLGKCFLWTYILVFSMKTCFLLVYAAGLQLVERSPERSMEEDIDSGPTTEVPGSIHEQATHGSMDAPLRKRQHQGTVVMSINLTCIL